MKRILIGLLALGSLSAFANEYSCYVAKNTGSEVAFVEFKLPAPNSPVAYKTNRTDVVVAWADPITDKEMRRLNVYMIPSESKLIDQHGKVNFFLAEQVASFQVGGDYVEGQKSVWLHTVTRQNGKKIELDVSCNIKN